MQTPLVHLEPDLLSAQAIHSARIIRGSRVDLWSNQLRNVLWIRSYKIYPNYRVVVMRHLFLVQKAVEHKRLLRFSH